MPKETLPDVDPPVRPAEIQRAGVRLAGHGLADVRPTPSGSTPTRPPGSFMRR
ncbi:hypothetical protein [Plantactinospora sp. BB1]|uniref:hypothetical protein n=1 Tax=Plantactinospora sp. BB1 TaxID=2071627 RepID=UPI00131F3D98|nr:hypothetical protein [Plantactinospora sp. BB1]